MTTPQKGSAMKTLYAPAVCASLAGLFPACSFCFAQGVKKPAEGSELRVGVVGDQYRVVTALVRTRRSNTESLS